jgi:lysophospholipase L1-like esterase
MKRFISFALALIMTIYLSFSLVSCDIAMQGAQGVQGEKGDQGDQGEKGDTGASIQKIEFDAEGYLIITLTDGTVLDPVKVPDKEEVMHNFSDWYIIKNATCYEYGLKVRLCIECNYTETGFVDTAEHTYQLGICEECGSTNYGTANYDELTYVAFGDSITYGIDGTKASWGYMADPYPQLVGKLLGLKNVQNNAVSGATLCADSGHTNMTQKILSFNGEADIISVMLGVNDYALNMPLGDAGCRDNSTVYGSLYLIAEHLKKNYPDSFVFFMTPFPTIKSGGNGSTGKYNVSDVAEAVKYVANLYNIPVLDTYKYGKYELEMILSTNDGIHPSQDHFRKYTAPQIAWFISQNYGNESNAFLETIVYQNIYHTGYVKNNGEIVSQTKHHYCAISAENIEKIIITPPDAEDYNTNNLYYVVYVDQNNQVTCYAPIGKNTPTIIELGGTAQGTIYFNAFTDELNFVYVKEATIIYSTECDKQ